MVERAAGGCRVVIVSRAQCHLCQQAIAVARSIGVDPVVLDVDADPELLRRYTDHVPVTFVDGRAVSLWTLDPDQLRTALDGKSKPDQPAE